MTFLMGQQGTWVLPLLMRVAILNAIIYVHSNIDNNMPQLIYMLIFVCYGLFGPYNLNELKWWIGSFMIAASYLCGVYSLK
jgi:hypothetical protein